MWPFAYSLYLTKGGLFGLRVSHTIAELSGLDLDQRLCAQYQSSHSLWLQKFLAIGSCR